MGGWERRCAICSVHFNLARLRQKGESLANSWWKYPDHRGADVVCEERRNSGNRDHFTYKIVDNTIVDEWKNGGKNEPRYSSGTGIKAGSACERAGCDESEGDHASGGLGCDFGSQEWVLYNGWRISAEEMKIMNGVQVIIRPKIADEWEKESPETLLGKESNECASAEGYNWRPEADDDDDEPTSKYKLVLTGVTMYTPCDGELRFVPNRHNIGSHLMIDESGEYGLTDTGIPFHKPCYQILKRVARKRFPKLNVLDGVYEVWKQEQLVRGSDSLFRGVDVYWNDEQNWIHVPGTEYLAADPYKIPKLLELIETCVVDENSFLDERSSKDATQPNNATSQLISKDPFNILPFEITSYIAESLSMNDIQNLRSLSRAWRRISQSFYRDRILEEAPWLWELEALAMDGRNVPWCTLWQRCNRAAGGQGHAADQPIESQYGKWFDRGYVRHAKIAADAGWPFVTFISFDNDHGQRINGLVNRKRVWKAAEDMVLMMHKALSNNDSEQD